MCHVPFSNGTLLPWGPVWSVWEPPWVTHIGGTNSPAQVPLLPLAQDWGANTISTGVMSSCQNMRAAGLHAVNTYMAVLYAHRTHSKHRTKYCCCWPVRVAGVLLDCSICPSLWGCRAVVLVFLMASHLQTSWNTWASKVWPWSLFNSSGDPKHKKISFTRCSAVVTALWSGTEYASGYLVK